MQRNHPVNTRMLQLKDRNKQIPNGLRFYIPELKWNAPGPYASFTRICDAVEQVIRANPHLAQQHQWPQDRVGVENWVDNYNAQLVSQMGWDSPPGTYLLADNSPSSPKWSPSLQSENLQGLRAAAEKVKELVRGAKTLSEWDDSGEPPVDRNLSNQRASVCSSCKLNEAGDWTKWFTVPAAELITRRIATVQGKGISTLHDERLHFCSACSCPLKLKVHVPLPWIKRAITNEQKQRMSAGNPNCWVVRELAA